MIVVPKIEYDSIRCKIISASKQIVFYTTEGTDVQKSLPNKEIARIDFGDPFDQIVQPYIIYDTILCTILAINPDNLEYYSPEDNANHTLSKSDVLVCYLRRRCTMDSKEIYLNRFRQFHDVDKGKPSNILLKQDGTRIKARKIEIDENFIFFDISSKDLQVRTYAPRNQVKSYSYSEFTPNSSKVNISNYILTYGGNLKECTFIKMDSTKLYMEMKVGEIYANSEIDINGVCALFFGPPEMDFSIKSPSKYSTVAQPKSVEKNAKIEFNINGKWGYQFAPVMEVSLNELTEYAKELRSGYGLGSNLNIYTGKHSSLGITYNFMRFNNIIYDIDFVGITSLSNNIQLNFYGFNYQFCTLRKKRFICDFSIAPGYVTYTNDSTVNHLSFTSKGKTFGLNLTSRYNIMANKNIGFFFDVSLFLGSLKKYEFEGQPVELDEPRNLSRIEIGIGIKFIAE